MHLDLPIGYLILKFGSQITVMLVKFDCSASFSEMTLIIMKLFWHFQVSLLWGRAKNVVDGARIWKTQVWAGGEQEVQVY